MDLCAYLKLGFVQGITKCRKLGVELKNNSVFTLLCRCLFLLLGLLKGLELGGDPLP